MSTVTKKGSQATSDDWDEFRNLCLLVTLVTAINDSGGHSKLNQRRGSISVDSKTQTVMHAITTILMLEHKILACMVEKPSDISAASGSVLVVQDDRMGRYEVDHDDEYGWHRLLASNMGIRWIVFPAQVRAVQPVRPIPFH